MQTLAVYGIKGGSGASSLVAALAFLRQQQHRSVLAIDLCQQNLLRLHFGMRWKETDGWCARLLAGEDWGLAAWQQGEHLKLVPYGKTSAWARCAVLDNPAWLRSELASLALPHDTLTLLDLPCGAVRARQQGLTAASHVLVVLPADSASCALLDDVEAELQSCGISPQQTLYALNLFDPLRQLDLDVELVLRKRLGARLAPLPVQRDACVREAFAAQRSLFSYAPASQAADDCRQLSVWLSVQLENREPAC